MKRTRRNVLLVLVAILFAIVFVLWIAFRNYAPTYNQPLREAVQPAAVRPTDEAIARGMWPDRPEQDDRTLVLVAISGGGTRAAAVGWKALETLRTVPYRFRNAGYKTAHARPISASGRTAAGFARSRINPHSAAPAKSTPA